ncbi:unnamed protein product, partial [Ectocarpus fasciculatus]
SRGSGHTCTRACTCTWHGRAGICHTTYVGTRLGLSSGHTCTHPCTCTGHGRAGICHT